MDKQEMIREIVKRLEQAPGYKLEAVYVFIVKYIKTKD